MNDQIVLTNSPSSRLVSGGTKAGFHFGEGSEENHGEAVYGGVEWMAEMNMSNSCRDGGGRGGGGRRLG